MKKRISILTLLLFTTLFIACHDVGESTKILDGNSSKLPPELKGLTIYTISINSFESIKVGLLDNKIIGSTYQNGKKKESIIIIDKSNDNTIEVSEILSQNDSIIVCKK